MKGISVRQVTTGLMNDVQKSDLISFDQYLIFFDETFDNHHHITCTLSRFNGKDYSPISKSQNFMLFRYYFCIKIYMYT